MRTLDEFQAALREAILSVYKRAVMHAQPGSVEEVLYAYHVVWALLHGREDEFQKYHNDLYFKEHANCGFYRQYAQSHDPVNEREAYCFIFERWSAVSKAFGIDVPASSWEHLKVRPGPPSSTATSG